VQEFGEPPNPGEQNQRDASEAPISNDAKTLPKSGGMKNQVSLKYKIVGAGVLAALLAGAAIGIAGANSGTAPEKAAARESASADPTEKPTPTPSATIEMPTGPTIEQLIASHKIKANQTPQALAQNILKEYASWNIYGSDTVSADFLAQVQKSGDASDAAEAAFIQPIISKGMSEYAPALYGPNYQTNPDVKDIISLFTEISRTDLLSAIVSGGSEKPYIRGIELSGDPITSTPTSIVMNATTTDNAGIGNKLPASGSVNGRKITIGISYRIVGDNIEIQKVVVT
jgi:hypothetical protein